MSLGVKERPANDSLEVRALFAIHRSLGKNGRLWIKNHQYRRQSGEVYRSLIGAVHSVSNQPEFKKAHTRDTLLQLLFSALPRHYRSAHVLSYGGALKDFNDRPKTTWADVETTLARAIQIGRDRAR